MKKHHNSDKWQTCDQNGCGSYLQSWTIIRVKLQNIGRSSSCSSSSCWSSSCCRTASCISTSTSRLCLLVFVSNSDAIVLKLPDEPDQIERNWNSKNNCQWKMMNTAREMYTHATIFQNFLHTIQRSRSKCIEIQLFDVVTCIQNGLQKSALGYESNCHL